MKIEQDIKDLKRYKLSFSMSLIIKYFFSKKKNFITELNYLINYHLNTRHPELTGAGQVQFLQF